MNSFRDERHGITVNYENVKKIIRKRLLQISANKFDSLDEIGKFLERHKGPKSPQEAEANWSKLSGRVHAEHERAWHCSLRI